MTPLIKFLISLFEKVKITTCCPMCKKFTGVDVGKELKGNWTLKAINTNDVKIGKNKENLVVVKLENKEKKIKNTIVKNELIRERNYDFLFKWMRRFAKCVDCGYNDIRALEFDHVRGEKYKGVKDMCNRTASIKSIKEEIRKCIPLCRNCHTDFHFQEKQTGISIKNYLKTKNLYQLSGIIFVIVSLLPILPTGSFLSTFTSSIFWLNFAIMCGYNNFKS